ncbi:unnamed protein product [Euphydryas editha]|uniref:CCHC-type domain-containing protein n=1 Tax=Euphydryas editha TaxID=104508 RepID=A0AAU9TZD5_EUPED|nr:unnamed protein product [Euphydryas editha]
MTDSEHSVKSEKIIKPTKMSNAITLNFLTKFIKPYDGKRETLPAFLTNCDNAISLASNEQQTILCKFIISQLEGKAQVACSLKTFHNWPELKDYLKQNFSEKKHSSHLLSDLQNCKQKLPLETVTQFSLRIESCLTRLLSDVHFSCDKKEELIGRVAGIEDLALNTFLMGLNPSFSHIVRCRNPKTLNEAVTHAIEEEKLFNATKFSSKTLKTCSTCNKQGHLSSECYRNRNKNVKSYNTNLSDTNNYPNRFPMQTQLSQIPHNFSRKICAYCKKPGHMINECRKRQYNNQRRISQQHDTQAQSSDTRRSNANVNFCDSNNMSVNHSNVNETLVSEPLNQIGF